MSTTKFGDVRGSVRTTVTTEPTAFNKVKPTGSTETTVNPRMKQVDQALELTSDLINDQYRAWYAKQAHRLGADRYIGLASDARQGRKPRQFFSYLLRNAV